MLQSVRVDVLNGWDEDEGNVHRYPRFYMDMIKFILEMCMYFDSFQWTKVQSREKDVILRDEDYLIKL